MFLVRRWTGRWLVLSVLAALGAAAGCSSSTAVVSATGGAAATGGAGGGLGGVCGSSWSMPVASATGGAGGWLGEDGGMLASCQTSPPVDQPLPTITIPLPDWGDRKVHSFLATLVERTARGWTVRADPPTPYGATFELKDGGLLAASRPNQRLAIEVRSYCAPFSRCPSSLIVRNESDGSLVAAWFDSSPRDLQEFGASLALDLSLGAAVCDDGSWCGTSNTQNVLLVNGTPLGPTQELALAFCGSGYRLHLSRAIKRGPLPSGSRGCADDWGVDITLQIVRAAQAN